MIPKWFRKWFKRYGSIDYVLESYEPGICESIAWRTYKKGLKDGKAKRYEPTRPRPTD